MGRVPSPTQAGEAWIGEYLAILRQQYPPNSDGKLTPSPSCHSTKGHQREPHSTPPTAGVGRDGLCWEMECRNLPTSRQVPVLMAFVRSICS